MSTRASPTIYTPPPCATGCSASDSRSASNKRFFLSIFSEQLRNFTLSLEIELENGRATHQIIQHALKLQHAATKCYNHLYNSAFWASGVQAKKYNKLCNAVWSAIQLIQRACAADILNLSDFSNAASILSQSVTAGSSLLDDTLVSALQKTRHAKMDVFYFGRLGNVDPVMRVLTGYVAEIENIEAEVGEAIMRHCGLCDQSQLGMMESLEAKMAAQRVAKERAAAVVAYGPARCT